MSRPGGSPSETHIWLICAALAGAVFVVDVFRLPLGVAAGVAYVPAVLVALWLPKWQQTFVVAGAVSLLTMLGYLLSEPAGIPWMVVANRLLALSAIWLTAVGGSWLAVTRRRKADEELRLAALEADRARAAKLRFMLSASNDIRHHLQTLVLLNAALRRTSGEAKAQEMLGAQGEALGHLSDLMNSLLDITDIESGQVEASIERVQVDRILEKLDREFRGSAKAKKLELEIASSDDVVHTDPNLLMQALRSLLSNAIRYTEKGRITVRCLREDGGLRLKVCDTGIGIPDDHLTGIFDEFYRVEYDRAGRNAGLGLGLTIVDRIAKLLDIRLNVESKVGWGSCFSLLLPLVAETL
ncbi:MAG: HAMP domain-containing histidine kinase [Proteobacteria bacterium]|nr:HAMP domain-containing histidine kinase [Pseudomonadota bacterium]